MEQKNTLRFKISGVCGILTPIIAFMCIFLSIDSAEFSWVDNALSDLGVVPGVTSTLFNWGLIVGGIFGFIFATGLFGVMRFFEVFSSDGKSPNLLFYRGSGGALFFSLACLALIAIGVFPESVKYLHTLASVAFFVLLIIALGRLGIGFLQVRRKRWAMFTLLLCLIAAVPWLVLFFVRYVAGVAIPEFISAVAGGLWAAVFGFKMLKLASQKNL